MFDKEVVVDNQVVVEGEVVVEGAQARRELHAWLSMSIYKLQRQEWILECSSDKAKQSILNATVVHK